MRSATVCKLPNSAVHECVALQREDGEVKIIQGMGPVDHTYWCNAKTPVCPMKDIKAIKGTVKEVIGCDYPWLKHLCDIHVNQMSLDQLMEPITEIADENQDWADHADWNPSIRNRLSLSAHTCAKIKSQGVDCEAAINKMSLDDINLAIKEESSHGWLPAMKGGLAEKPLVFH